MIYREKVRGVLSRSIKCYTIGQIRAEEKLASLGANKFLWPASPPQGGDDAGRNKTQTDMLGSIYFRSQNHLRPLASWSIYHKLVALFLVSVRVQGTWETQIAIPGRLAPSLWEVKNAENGYFLSILSGYRVKEILVLVCLLWDSESFVSHLWTAPAKLTNETQQHLLDD